MNWLFALLLLPNLAWAAAFDHTHNKWDDFLKDHVVLIDGGNSSQMNYKKAATARVGLDSYLKEVEAVTPAEYAAMSDRQKQALLINGYNAFTVKLILDNKIPKSIKDTGSFLRSPWKKKFFKFLGKESHLDHLEHDLARGKFNQCRFHFAFNCASVGCPALRHEAWLDTKLDEQFEDAAKRFLSDRSRNTYVATSNTLELSKIFDWYAKDFEKDPTCGGSVQAFVSRYIPLEAGKKIPANAKIKYLDYNWKLNKTP
jgi:hypothetical protein